MNINNFIRNHFARTEQAQLTFSQLQPNQIIQGKIVKLYPNNQAMIQIGREQKMAQLDTPLAVGERYYFQVVKNAEFMHLKVIGEPLAKTQSSTNVVALLQQLGLSTDRQLINFVQHLIREQIPFDRSTLSQIQPLLANTNNKLFTQQILQQMIVNEMPLTVDVFRAQQTLLSTNLTDILKLTIDKPLQTQLSQTPHGQQVLAHMRDFSEPLHNQQFVRAVLQKVQEQPTIRHLFSGLNLIHPNANFSDQTLHSIITHDEQMFTIEPSMLRDVLQTIVNNKQQTNQVATTLLQNWEESLLRIIQAGKQMPAQDFNLFQEQVKTLISSLLADGPLVSHVNITNQPEQLQVILNMLQSLQEPMTYQQLEQVQTANFAAKSEFLQQIHYLLSHLGLNYEQLIVNGQVNELQHTLKQTLLQMIQQQLPINQERVQQLIHFINGLQLQAVEETNHFIYGNFILPGEKMRLNNDLYMQFQSKKTADGKVDASHCRILFFLDLQALDQTIVDMNIQDRIVSITVFNDHHFLKSLVKPLENSLKHQLNKLDYQLSSVTYKPLEDDDQMVSKTRSPQFTKKDYSGVDFRI